MLSTVVFVIIMVVLFYIARPLFFNILSGLIFLALAWLFISLLFFGVGLYFDSNGENKSQKDLTETHAYENRVEKTLTRLNKNTWEIQLYFINRGEHDLAEKVIQPKSIMDVVGLHYLSINPQRINRFIMEDYRVWQSLPKIDSEEWLKLKREHNAIINELQALKKMYPAQ